MGSVATKDNNCLIIETVTDFKKQDILQKLSLVKDFILILKNLIIQKAKRAFLIAKV